MEIKDVFLFYECKIVPVYNYFVAMTGEKPIQVLVEVENAFAHLAKACIKPDNVDANKERAYGHLVRLYYDLYKLLLLEIKRVYEKKYSLFEGELVGLIREARSCELSNIGSSDEKIVELVGGKYEIALNAILEKLNIGKMECTK